MRRLLFNPLAQQPYASGVLDKSNNQFVLDNPLEEGHLYYCKIFSFTDSSLTTCIIDTTNGIDTHYTTPFVLIDVDTNYKNFYGMWYKNNAKHIVINTASASISTDDDYIIYVYKLI